MKKIYFILATLVILISGMSYMYFSTLNKAGVQADSSLELVSKNAGLVFSFQNDKSVRNILNGQDLLNNLVGEEKAASLRDLQANLKRKELAPLFEGQNVYLGIYPSEEQKLDFMIAVQLNPEANEKLLAESLKRSGLTLKPYSTYQQVQLSNSQTFYVLVRQRVILIANASRVIDKLIAVDKRNTEADFISFIQKSDRLAKNSLANLYINFKQLGHLMKSITPYFNRGDLAVLSRQNAYARLTYNFSKEKVYFSGESKVINADSYFSLFASLKPEKIEIDKVLPANTASFTLYAFGDYKTFHSGLQKWFAHRNEDKNVQGKIKSINEKYRLNLDEVFLRYTNSQALTVQLQNKQKLAVIKLNSGEKVEQLLLDLSEDYDGEIRRLKEPDLLYYYFGEPFSGFKTPYYMVINNYIIFAVYPSTLLDFRNSYQANKLLILDQTYAQVYKQLPSNANILFYLNNRKAQNILINTIYPLYYDQFRSEKGLKVFDSFVYQLSGDQGTFQANVLFTTPPTNGEPLNLEADSLSAPK